MKRIEKGFTLVEVTIALAIASLIISLVFVAAGAAQRNGRDTTRRADTNKLATAIEQWSANNNGILPDNATNPISNVVNASYLDLNKFKDPSSGATYAPQYAATIPTTCTNPGDMYYTPSGNSYTLVTCLESGKYTYTP